MLTPQEVFSKTAEHLLTQDARSVSRSGRCSYRGANGLMCAVGVLIPDSAYRSDLEDNPADAGKVLQSLRGVVDIEDREMISILVALQEIHDSEAPEDWDRHLRELAQIHRLEMPEVQL